jgi:hypothetical protein
VSPNPNRFVLPAGKVLDVMHRQQVKRWQVRNMPCDPGNTLLSFGPSAVLKLWYVHVLLESREISPCGIDVGQFCLQIDELIDGDIADSECLIVHCTVYLVVTKNNDD